jgi:hydrogenase-4 component F
LVAGTPEAAFTSLIGFVAMTTSWFSARHVTAALVRRSIDPRGARVYHAAYQAFVAALVCALLSDICVLTWLMLAASIAAAAALTGSPLTVTALAAVRRMLPQCGVALMLALFGIVALHIAAAPIGVSLHWSTLTQAHRSNSAILEFACICLILGSAALAGLLPPRPWLPDAVTEVPLPGAILLGALWLNVPLLLILRVRVVAAASVSITAVLLALGLAALLLAACLLSPRPDLRRMVVLTGMAQAGIVMFAFGLGTPHSLFAGLLLLTLLSLVRASVLQCQELPPSLTARCTGAASIAVLTALPLFGLLLIAAATIDYAAWLMVPLAGGVLLVTWALISRIPVPAWQPAGHMFSSQTVARLALVPIWLQLAITLLLALAMPASMVAWFQLLARTN